MTTLRVRGCGIVVIAVALAGTLAAAPPPQRRTETVASPGIDPWVSRAAKLQVRPQRSADAPLQVDFPTKDWMVLPSSGALVLAAASRKGDAVVLIERSPLRQALDPEEITDLFAQLEIDAIKERQPKAADFERKVLDSGGRRLVALQYSRPGVLGNELVRQYSLPVGTDLYRVVCISSAARFAAYDPVFSHVAASLTITG